MSPTRFEPPIPASERPQTPALDSAATGIGLGSSCLYGTQTRGGQNAEVLVQTWR